MVAPNEDGKRDGGESIGKNHELVSVSDLLEIHESGDAHNECQVKQNHSKHQQDAAVSLKARGGKT